MVKVLHDVGGVPGLDVALDAFSEDVERRLFESSVLFDISPEEASHVDGRNGMPTGPMTWDPDVWKITNLRGDLFPAKHVPPDYCLGLSYPKSAQFNSHYDSRYRWGECITGVCLGQAGVIYFTQQKGSAPKKWKTQEGGPKVNVQTQKCGKICVEVQLPRRCIYTFHGPARLDWKHGIRHQTVKRLATFPAPPSWNPWNLRRSLTFRCTKAYSDAYLQHQLELKPSDTNLQDRWKQQTKFRPQHDYGEGAASDEQLAKMRAHAQTTLKMILQSPFRSMRFGGFHGTTSGGNHLGSDALEEEDDELQAAIRLSLGESQQGSSSNGGGSAADPIALDDDDNDDENTDSKPPAQSPNDVKRAATDQEETPESKRQRLRLARLRRFAVQHEEDV